MKYSTKKTPFVVILPIVVVLIISFLLPMQNEALAARKRRTGPRSLNDYLQQYSDLQEKLTDRLDQMLDVDKYVSIQDELEQWKTPHQLVSNQISKIPKEVRPEIDFKLPKEEYEARKELRRVLRKHAIEIYQISRKLIKAGHPSYAYFLIREVIRYDSDNKSARKALGFVRYGKIWVTPFAAQKYRNKFVWHERFGWLKKSHVEKYENGQRYYHGKWISVAKETAIRQDFRRAWVIQTDHYLVKTNHSLEKGVEIATKLEEFYQHFFHLFTSFFNSREQMEKLFANGKGSRATRKKNLYEVHYFRTREEYNRSLIHKIHNINITDGLYYTTDRTAYFFNDPKQDKSHTLFHEATHQLFYESLKEERRVAFNRDFWLLEGIACYMESFRINDGVISLGDPNYNRFKEAGYRFLINRYYIPLEQLSAIPSNDYQNHPEIRKNYSQSAGLAKFLMEYKDGLYRDALIQHLSNLYKGEGRRRNRFPTLSELIGVDYRTLDRQYGEFIVSEEADLIKGMVEIDSEE